MKKSIKSRLTACVLLLAVVYLGTVVADDVVVKQGTIGTGSVSPDLRAKVFIGDGADDISYPEGDYYGLLTITTDSTNGTDTHYGTMCEFFPDATGSGEGAGYGKLAGAFFNCPVGTENANARMYWGLYSLTCPWSGYSTAGKIREREQYDINIVEEEGRSLGGMITVLTEAVKGLNEKVESLQAENQTLKAEIAALKAQ